ncbi:hypothetical protein HanIR_Chr16g0844341 [Helianthus annuus]|nr:hypothetical protein HanIR_Chr16g0844341 [Helianthus annuus]
MAKSHRSYFCLAKIIWSYDGTSSPPSSTITVEDKVAPNPDAVSWNENDQKVVILLQSSLTEEAAGRNYWSQNRLSDLARTRDGLIATLPLSVFTPYVNPSGNSRKARHRLLNFLVFQSYL